MPAKPTHYLQPTNHACSPAALASLLSWYGETITPEQIMQDAPINHDEKGNELGTINQNLAEWCLNAKLKQRYDAQILSADFLLLDLTWAKLPKDKLLERLHASLGKHMVKNVGEFWSQKYLESYISFIEAGGELLITPYISQEQLSSLVKNGPVMVAVAFGVLYNTGHGTEKGLRKSIPDDINGHTGIHSLCIYDISESGEYCCTDPWFDDGYKTVTPEKLLAAMAASQVECDNLVISLKPHH